MDPVDSAGDTLLDFSVFDAKRAGFGKVVFIIKHAIEAEFKEMIGSRIEPHIDVEYVFQENDLLPEGYSVPEGRIKPFGTGHAVLCAAPVVDAPFAVINADDYYGVTAFRQMYRFLSEEGRGEAEEGRGRVEDWRKGPGRGLERPGLPESSGLSFHGCFRRGNQPGEPAPASV